MVNRWLEHTGLEDPTCALKFGWSTIRLSEGTTASCHRTDSDQIINFQDFHNTPIKQQAWPINRTITRELRQKNQEAGICGVQGQHI